MTYVIKYSVEINDVIFKKEIEIEAEDSVEAMKKFFESNPNYRIINGIRELRR